MTNFDEILGRVEELQRAARGETKIRPRRKSGGRVRRKKISSQAAELTKIWRRSQKSAAVDHSEQNIAVEAGVAAAGDAAAACPLMTISVISETMPRGPSFHRHRRRP